MGIPPRIKQGRNIVHFEMYNVLVALSMWAEEWVGPTVCGLSGNMAVIQALNSLCINDIFLGECLRNMLMVLVKHNIHLEAKHIRCVENREPDALSRLATSYGTHKWVLYNITGGA